MRLLYLIIPSIQIIIHNKGPKFLKNQFAKYFSVQLVICAQLNIKCDVTFVHNKICHT